MADCELADDCMEVEDDISFLNGCKFCEKCIYKDSIQAVLSYIMLKTYTNLRWFA